jgi:hypothetical protein
MPTLAVGMFQCVIGDSHAYAKRGHGTDKLQTVGDTNGQPFTGPADNPTPFRQFYPAFPKRKNDSNSTSSTVVVMAT